MRAYGVGGSAAVVTLLLVSCSGDPASPGATGACGGPGPRGPTDWAIAIDGVGVTGENAVWVDRDGWIALGPEDVGPTDAVAVVGMTVGEFHTLRDDPLTPETVDCTANILTATISTSRQAQGTAAQVDARLYEYVPPSEENVPFIRIDSVGGGAIRGGGQFPMRRLIILPNEPPQYGETVFALIGFVAREP